jgi:solute carrier family 25 2-oxodicarboxylate transporter 21
VRRRLGLDLDLLILAYCALHINRVHACHQGAVGFSRGIGAAMARNGTWNGIYFGCIRYINETLPKATSKGEQLRNNFIAGTVGGIVGTTGNTPFDVVCSRLRNWVPGEPRKYTCVPD